MEIDTAKRLKQGDQIIYANGIYKVAELKEFPHGLMIGIYDEPPSKHIDYLQLENVEIDI